MDCSPPGSPVLQTPRVCSNSCPLSQWCYPTILSSATPLLFPSIFPSIKVFSMSQLFASGGQSIVASASASVLLVNIQGWFPWGLTGWISLQSKGLSGVFFSTTKSQMKQLPCCLHISCEFSAGDITPVEVKHLLLCLRHRSAWCTD